MSFNRFSRSASDDCDDKGDENETVFHSRIPSLTVSACRGLRRWAVTVVTKCASQTPISALCEPGGELRQAAGAAAGDEVDASDRNDSHSTADLSLSAAQQQRPLRSRPTEGPTFDSKRRTLPEGTPVRRPAQLPAAGSRPHKQGPWTSFLTPFLLEGLPGTYWDDLPLSHTTTWHWG